MIRKILKEHGIKYTVPREQILQTLMDSPIPLTLQQIKESIDKDIDLSTLYRNLDTFETKGIITKTVHLEPGQNVYDYKRHIHKHHIICTKCQTIDIIEGCPLEDYEKQIANTTGYIIERHQLELYGICPQCQKQKK